MTVDVKRCPNCGGPVSGTAAKRYCSRPCQVRALRTPTSPLTTRVHVVIPDTQVKPGTPTRHLEWIGAYIADKYAGRAGVELTVVHLGDHWDMPSLSSYDRGKRAMEGRRYVADVEAGNDAFELLHDGFRHVECRRVFLLGNHEHRIERAVEDDAQLEGLVTYDHLYTAGWERHGFLRVVDIDGIAYSHYHYNPMSGRPYSGQIETRLKNVGRSFTQGHQQTLQYGLRFVGERSQHALVAGACYLHDEDYKGPQGNAHWRGVVVCHNVDGGSYDPMFVSLDFLCRRFEGMTLDDYLRKAA